MARGKVVVVRKARRKVRFSFTRLVAEEVESAKGDIDADRNNDKRQYPVPERVQSTQAGTDENLCQVVTHPGHYGRNRKPGRGFE